MLKKVKGNALGTRTFGGVINGRQLKSMVTSAVTANKPTLSKDFGGDLVLTEKWARGVMIFTSVFSLSKVQFPEKHQYW